MNGLTTTLGLNQDWPLVGRAGELNWLSAALTGEESRGVVLAGPSGAGKTRLALEALHLAERQGFVVVQVRATRGANEIPFGALAPLLPVGHSEMAGAVDDRTDMLRRSVAAITERAAGRRLVLMVDDAHLLDDASAHLVHQLAATRDVLVLATLRSRERAPDAIMSLWKDGLAERVDLHGLTDDDIEELLHTVLGGPVDPAVVAQLAARSRGNALFLRELVIGALEANTLRDDGDMWRLTGRLVPSERLVELVEARLAGLSGAQRALLEAVSIGEPLGTAELAQLADVSLAEGLEEAGLLTSQVDGRRLEIRLAQPIYGDVLQRSVSPLRTRKLVRSLAGALEAAGGRRRDDVLRIGTWRLNAGGTIRPDLMLAAATIARWRYDFPLAERLVRSALAAGAGFSAAMLAAQLAGLQGRAVDAEAEFLSLSRLSLDDGQRASVTILRANNLSYGLGRFEEAIRVAEEAEAAMTEPAWRDEVAAHRSGMVLAIEGPCTAAEMAHGLRSRAQGGALVQACVVAAAGLAKIGRLGEALEAADQGQVAQLGLIGAPLPWYPWMLGFLRCEALVYAGRLREAETSALEEYRHARAEGSAERQAWFAWQLCRVSTNQGRVARAIRYGREAAGLLRQQSGLPFLRQCLVNLATALAVAGRAEEASAILKELDVLGLPPVAWTEADLIQARAWTAVAHGELAQARRLLCEATAKAEAFGDLMTAISAIHDLARLGGARDVAGQLSALAEQVEGELAPVRAAHARAVAADSGDDADAASVAFEAMGALLLAAEAASDAACAWRRRGEPRRAASAQRRAVVLAGQCEGAATPALAGAEHRALLTPAELDTARLAAAGRSNKEIAKALYLSVRTVENRLHRIYEKLGVGGRSELVHAMER